MNILGIISEYNPFHNGHLYHLNEAKKLTNAKGVVCVMSGNFMQRGEPALVNKWARAKMAINNGVDLVFELPVLYATQSAYWFAKGGIETLAATSIVSHLALGVEATNPSALSDIARILAKEPVQYQNTLKQYLKEGLSFPQARAQALSKEISFDKQLLETPNNILAISYLQLLIEKESNLIPVMIKRKGSEYLETNIQEETLPSATAIRNFLTQHSSNYSKSLQEIKNHCPNSTLKILEEEFKLGRGPISLESLTPHLLTLLRRTTPQELQNITNVSEGLENRIHKLALQTTNLKEFLTKLKTKRYTYTRLQRFLIHLLLNYTTNEETYLQKGPAYLHLLGFSERGKELLKKIQKEGTLPIITKGAHINKYLQNNPQIQCSWNLDTLATDIYSLLFPLPQNRTGNLDYLQKPVTR